MKTNLTEQIGYARSQSLLTRILRALGQAGVIIGCAIYFTAVALWDTVVAGKSAGDQDSDLG